MAQITAEDLSLGYDRHPVAKHISFTLNKGDYLCVVGENGSGKSTLIKTLLKLIPPLSGKIAFGDSLTPRQIGYLPQQTPQQRDFPASVFEIVLSGFAGRMGFRPFYTVKDKQIARENMKRLGIDALSDRCYRELSGGQQQRVLLARALCATRDLLLLDEPVSGLDPIVTAELYEIIGTLNKNDGITVLMVSHDVSAIFLASHVLHISTDQTFFGTVEQYKQSNLARSFICAEKEERE